MLEIELETGRYHQIRAQLAFAGHPIIGDSKYGSKQSLPNGAIALCHTRLEFPHPVREERIVINAVT
jgi:23S rRNA pseudouridine1911/1915/1917 synthase